MDGGLWCVEVVEVVVFLFRYIHKISILSCKLMVVGKCLGGENAKRKYTINPEPARPPHMQCNSNYQARSLDQVIKMVPMAAILDFQNQKMCW